MIYRRTTCRVCSGSNLSLLWDFGSTPLANAYPRDLDMEEAFYPLQVNKCVDCGNVQLTHVVDAKTLFNEYLYVSSTSKVFVKHFEDFAKEYTSEFHPTNVLDIGSNDGILLKPFQDLGCYVLGVEPAKNIQTSVPTIRKFFNKEVVDMLCFDPGSFDLITATNVFAHIDDLDEVVDGVKRLLSPAGQFVVEVADLDQMLQDGSFDLIYHEHLNYWSEKAFKKFFELRGMKVTRVEKIPVHGGSLRIYAQLSN